MMYWGGRRVALVVHFLSVVPQSLYIGGTVHTATLTAGLAPLVLEDVMEHKTIKDFSNDQCVLTIESFK